MDRSQNRRGTPGGDYKYSIFLSLFSFRPQIGLDFVERKDPKNGWVICFPTSNVAEIFLWVICKVEKFLKEKTTWKYLHLVCLVDTPIDLD